MAVVTVNHETLRVRRVGSVCYVQLHRPADGNAINDALVGELGAVLLEARRFASVVVLEGSPEVFCSGADLSTLDGAAREGSVRDYDPSPLYDLWLDLASGPYITVSHVQGTASAGGLGFVAASDVVVAARSATFSLPEMLFGLYPAMVLPFLVRRVGHQRAHYMTLSTRTVPAEQAQEWGLVDCVAERSEQALAQLLGRLTKLPPDAVAAYKRHTGTSLDAVHGARGAAVRANQEIFADPGNVARITRFVREGVYPWESVAAAGGTA